MKTLPWSLVNGIPPTLEFLHWNAPSGREVADWKGCKHSRLCPADVIRVTLSDNGLGYVTEMCEESRRDLVEIGGRNGPVTGMGPITLAATHGVPGTRSECCDTTRCTARATRQSGPKWLHEHPDPIRQAYRCADCADAITAILAVVVPRVDYGEREGQVRFVLSLPRRILMQISGRVW